MVAITLVRHATLLIDFEGARLLVDPMLSDRGQMDPIPNSPNDRRNPLVDLPDVDLDADAVLVTHRHRDHLDDVAREWLPHTLPVLCQPADAADLAETFSDVRPVDGEREFEELGLTATRVPARHGHGALAEEMGPVSSSSTTGRRGSTTPPTPSGTTASRRRSTTTIPTRSSSTRGPRSSSTVNRSR